MKNKFVELVSQGFKPAVYIEREQFKPLTDYPELRKVALEAARIGYKVFKSAEDTELRQLHKLYIFRYGHIPPEITAMIKRKGGIIVSGTL